MKPAPPLFALLLSLLVKPVSPAAEFRVGEPFPAIVLPSIEEGAALSAEQFRGQKLMLHVFASW